MLIDTHCHLDKSSAEKISKELSNTILIASGVDRKTNEQVIELVEKYDNIYGTIGIQPTEVKYMKQSDLDFIEKNMNNLKIIGIGEVGLDYHWDDSNKEEQKEVFIKQIELAKKYNKTLVIHARGSIDDTHEILKKHLGGAKAILHCFCESYEIANRFFDLNIKFGIGGIVTFKNAETIRDAVKFLPIEKIVLETDSPFLAPAPYRGKKNSPLYLKFIAEEIAKIRGTDYWEIVKKTGENALNQFDLKHDL